MKSIPYLVIFCIFFIFSTSCEKTDNKISEEEIVQGLKEALKVGTDTSVTTASKKDGYYGDLAIKIFLPNEAKIIVDNKESVPGLSILVDSMILKINRAAEDAAIEAQPIFINAITSMTIVDAINILNSSDTSATHYLKQTTYNELKNLFQPKIDISLNKPIIGVSANSMWNSVTGLWNNFVDNGGWAFGYSNVNITLSEHVTNKALNGLFLKVANEEKEIRNDPVARVNDILIKVFGSKN